nr:type I pullulanase [Tissierella sp.]
MKDFGTTEKQLGMIYSKDKTTFRVWSPMREKIELALYETANLENRQVFMMDKLEDGVHELVLQGDHKGKFYRYNIKDSFEVTDPYSISSAINSSASAIIDLEDTNPKGFKEHKVPKIDKKDAVIYEVHVKDFTASETSGVKNRGKYLGFVEEGSQYKGYKTGIDHLKELGVNHIHLLPVYDFISVEEKNESFLLDKNYNWGYDPELYNAPEGSYATDPHDPLSRVLELKTLIMKLHENGFKVVVDVVYNHTYKSFDSNLDNLMPGYYYRMTKDGKFSDGTGTGNEIDSEMPMSKRLIIDSLIYWMEEYKIDGFRFDLLGLMDIDTTKEIVKTLKEINPEVVIYGEPWGGGKTTLPLEKMSLKGTQKGLGFSYFNDDFRNALKGDNNGDYPGFIQGNAKYKWDVEAGIIGSIDYNNTHRGFAENPLESINYINCHDDLIIYDKMVKTFPQMHEEDIEKLNRFAFSILLTAQGIPFITNGNEILRSKQGIANTYRSPITINQIDWSLKKKNIHFFKYMQDLIKLRAQNPEFNLADPQEINRKIKFMQYEANKNIIVYTIEKEDGYILVVHNGKFGDSYIETKDLSAFLKSKYDDKTEDFKISTLLGMDGLREEEYKSELKEIYIPAISTYVFSINRNDDL